MSNNVVTQTDNNASPEANIGPLLVIVGETGSGKSALALELAERYNGEILCADSRTVYRGMDIGTAKPSAADRDRVPHYGLDLVSPDERYSAADFKSYATQVMAQIAGRGKLPIIVGGTGLYIDAVIYDYQFRPAAEPTIRAELEALTIEELQSRLQAAGIPLPENSRNHRYLVRALETGGAAAERSGLRPQTLVLGLQVEREVLRGRIEARVAAMVAAGFVAEVRAVSKQYGWDCEALRAPGYRAFRNYLDGQATLDEATAEFIKNDMDLAKRQRTWFRRNKSIHWLTTDDKLAEAVEITTTLMNK